MIIYFILFNKMIIYLLIIKCNKNKKKLLFDYLKIIYLFLKEKKICL